MRLQVEISAASGWRAKAWRKPLSVGPIWSSANANRPRRSSGAVVWLMPSAQTAISLLPGSDYKIEPAPVVLPSPGKSSMNLLDIFNHLLNFLAPALAVAGLVVLGARLVMRNRAVALALWTQLAVNFLVGALTLVLGLWFFGRDGKMASYAALVMGCASSQWLMHKSWKD